MRSMPFVIMALTATAAALPNSIENYENTIGSEDANTESAAPLCKRLLGALPTKPECCKGDVLGLAHHGCAAPYPPPGNFTGFVSGCLKKGKAPKCCATAMLGVGLFCHTPTGNGFVTSALASKNGSEATIIEIAQSEDENEPATITEVIKELNDTEEALLADGPVSTVEELDSKLEAHIVELACDEDACFVLPPKGRPSDASEDRKDNDEEEEGDEEEQQQEEDPAAKPVY